MNTIVHHHYGVRSDDYDLMFLAALATIVSTIIFVYLLWLFGVSKLKPDSSSEQQRQPYIPQFKIEKTGVA